MKFNQREIISIVSDALSQAFSEEQMDLIISLVNYEIGKKIAWPEINPQGELLCKVCRIRYHNKMYPRCLECSNKIRVGL